MTKSTRKNSAPKSSFRSHFAEIRFSGVVSEVLSRYRRSLASQSVIIVRERRHIKSMSRTSASLKACSKRLCLQFLFFYCIDLYSTQHTMASYAELGTSTFHSLPPPNLATVTRKDMLDYLENTYDLPFFFHHHRHPHLLSAGSHI